MRRHISYIPRRLAALIRRYQRIKGPVPDGGGLVLGLNRWMLDEGEGLVISDSNGDAHGYISEDAVYTQWVDTPEGGPPQTKCLEIVYNENADADIEGAVTGLTRIEGQPMMPMTIEAWVRLSDVFDGTLNLGVHNASFVTHNANHPAETYPNICFDFGFGSGNPNKPLFVSFESGDVAEYFYVISTAAPLEVSVWNHWAVTVDQLGNGVVLKNGDVVTSSISSNEDVVYVSSDPEPYCIGKSGPGTWASALSRHRRICYGMMADIRIWDHVRTQQQIQDNMYATKNSIV